MRRILIALVLAAFAAGCGDPPPDPPGESDGLWSNTAWRLAGDGVEVILQFPERGRAVGRGPCNRYFALVAIDGDAIRFSGIGSTKMACADPLNAQEASYFEALESAERFAIEGGALVIYSRGRPKPLRFTRLTVT